MPTTSAGRVVYYHAPHKVQQLRSPAIPVVGKEAELADDCLRDSCGDGGDGPMTFRSSHRGANSQQQQQNVSSSSGIGSSGSTTAVVASNNNNTAATAAASAAAAVTAAAAIGRLDVNHHHHNHHNTRHHNNHHYGAANHTIRNTTLASGGVFGGASTPHRKHTAKNSVTPAGTPNSTATNNDTTTMLPTHQRTASGRTGGSGGKPKQLAVVPSVGPNTKSSVKAVKGPPPPAVVVTSAAPVIKSSKPTSSTTVEPLQPTILNTPNTAPMPVVSGSGDNAVSSQPPNLPPPITTVPFPPLPVIASALPATTATTTSKSMRQKNLDCSKPSPVFWREETAEPLLHATQQLVTGIDKEEEFEYHLLQARNAREPIPVTKTAAVPKALLEAEYRPVSQANNISSSSDSNTLAYLILEPDICEYNADTSDVKWVMEQGSLLGIDINRFEEYMEMLERAVSSSSSCSVVIPSSGATLVGTGAATTLSATTASFGSLSHSFNSHGNNVNNTRQHHPLLNGLITTETPLVHAATPTIACSTTFGSSADAVKRYIAEQHSEPAAIALYDYWLEKRCRIERSLILRVKAERKDGLNAKDPYVAFRRRTEKIQTRKNRRNEKMAYAALLRMQPEYAMLANLLDQKILLEQTALEEVAQERKMLSTIVALRDVDGLVYRDIERRIEHDFAPPHPSQQQRGMKRSAGGGNYADVDFGDDFSSQNGSVISSAPTMSHAASNAASKRKKRKKLKRDANGDGVEGGVQRPPVQFAETYAVTHSPYDSFDDTNSPDGRYTFLRKAFCIYQPPVLTDDDEDEEDDDDDDGEMDSDADDDVSDVGNETATGAEPMDVDSGMEQDAVDIVDGGSGGGRGRFISDIMRRNNNNKRQRSRSSNSNSSRRNKQLLWMPVVMPLSMPTRVLGTIRRTSSNYYDLHANFVRKNIILASLPPPPPKSLVSSGDDEVDGANVIMPPPPAPSQLQQPLPSSFGRLSDLSSSLHTASSSDNTSNMQMSSFSALPLRQSPLVSFSTTAAVRNANMMNTSSNGGGIKPTPVAAVSSAAADGDVAPLSPPPTTTMAASTTATVPEPTAESQPAATDVDAVLQQQKPQHNAASPQLQPLWCSTTLTLSTAADAVVNDDDIGYRIDTPYLPVYGRLRTPTSSQQLTLAGDDDDGDDFACYMKASLGRRGLMVSRLRTPFDPYLKCVISQAAPPKPNSVPAQQQQQNAASIFVDDVRLGDGGENNSRNNEGDAEKR